MLVNRIAHTCHVVLEANWQSDHCLGSTPGSSLAGPAHFLLSSGRREVLSDRKGGGSGLAPTGREEEVGWPRETIGGRDSLCVGSQSFASNNLEVSGKVAVSCL